MEDIGKYTGQLLYVFAAVLFLLSVVYFGAEAIFQLSPVTKSILILTVTDFLILTGIYSSAKLKSFLSYITGFISYLIFLTYTISVFRPSTELTLGLLMVSALGFAALGKIIDEKIVEIDRRKYLGLLGFIGCVLLLISAADMAGSQVDYQLDLEGQVTLEEGENVVGKISVSNKFYLTRNYEIPEYEACSPERKERRIGLDIASYSETEGTIPGNSDKTFNATIRGHHIPEDENSVIPEEDRPPRGEYKLELTNKCPSAGDNNTIYVFENEEEYRFD